VWDAVSSPQCDAKEDFDVPSQCMADNRADFRSNRDSETENPMPGRNHLHTHKNSVHGPPEKDKHQGKAGDVVSMFPVAHPASETPSARVMVY
jgi:hypothetical protein